MSVFTLAISCLTTSNLPWFVDLAFQFPMQYCSLQHQTLLSPPDIFTTFCVGPASSFFLELLVIALYSSPVAYWTLSDLGASSFDVISFCFFISFYIVHGLLMAGILEWFAIPFSSGPGFVIASLSYASPFTRTRLWSMWSFWLSFCDCGFCSGGCGVIVQTSSVCPLMDEDKRLVPASWWEELVVGKPGLVLVDRAMLSKSLIQFSTEGWGTDTSLDSC